MHTTSDKLYFPALTGLRAVAAYLVYAHHALPQVPLAPGFFRALFQEAHIGVSIFFVLSGFLIGIRYHQAFLPGSHHELRSYFLQRFARLYPVYLLCTLAALWFRQDFRPESWVINLLLLQGFFADYTFSGIGIAWSLTVELTFYAFAPLVLLYWDRLGLWRWTLLTLLAGLVLLALGQLPWPFGFLPDLSFLVRSTFFGRCFEFYVGIWLARKLLAEPPAFWLQPRADVFTYGGALGIVLFLLGLSFLRDIPGGLGTDVQTMAFHGLNNYLLPVCIAALLLGLVKEQTVLSTLLGSQVGQALGKGSYLFYLVHYTFGFDILYFHLWKNKGGVLLLLAILSVAGYYLLEAPLQKGVLRLAAKRLPKQ
ncbi:acyltransferase [Rufibacter immobilis]|uniref:Acyltransferase n=1 Tax=Rufibacter immobilis TaxID=1348778 RepID=A0A3M9MWS6_9BACT|nr:acyltransferase [Rufibacter immobilis]RNI29976.1 acyltransferase [Rufibacter immobilis]